MGPVNTDATSDHKAVKYHAKDRKMRPIRWVFGSVTHIAAYYTLIGQVFAYLMCIICNIGV